MADRPETFSDADWDQRVLENPTEVELDALVSNGGPTLLAFWAEWCVPSRTLAAGLPGLAPALTGWRVALVDVDRHPAAVGRFGLRGLPTVVIYEEGRERVRRVGLLLPDDLLHLARG